MGEIDLNEFLDQVKHQKAAKKAEKLALEETKKPKCSRCDSTDDVRLEVPGGAFPPELTLWEAIIHEGEQPLPRVLYCRDCSKKDEEWWDKEYEEVFGYPLR